MKKHFLCSVLALSLLFPVFSTARSEREEYAKVWPYREGMAVAAKALGSTVQDLSGQTSLPDSPVENLTVENPTSQEPDVEDEENTVVWYEFELGFLDQSGRYTPFVWENAEDHAGKVSYRFRQIGPELPDLEWGFYNGYICLPNPDGLTSDLYDTTGTPMHIGNGAFYPISQVTDSAVVCRSATGGAPGWYNLKTRKFIQADLTGHADWRIATLAPFCGGLAPAAVYWTDSNGEPTEARWGFVDESGKWVIAPTYTDYVVTAPDTLHQVFGDIGLALVRDLSGMWGGINRNGNTEIPFQYDALWPMENGQISFQLGTESGIVDGNHLPTTTSSPEETRPPLSEEVPTSPPTTNPTFSPEQTFPPASEMTPEPVNLEGVDSWAVEEIRIAISAGLVPNYLQCSYQEPVCRDEFCDLIIWTIRQATGKSLADLVLERTGKSFAAWRMDPPFQDTKNTNVIAAYALGVVNGREAGAFDPAAPITREEAAVMLTRAAGIFGLDTACPVRASFSDRNQVGIWFEDGVDYVSQMGIMNGVGYNLFVPKEFYTRQQSFLTALRLWQIVQKS